jgi:hypothetical protein
MALFAALTALSVVLYGIFLLEAVGNTAQRTAAEREIRNITSNVSSLEQAYLEKTKAVTLEKAQSLGFVSPSSVTTVFASAQQKSLTFGR